MKNGEITKRYQVTKDWDTQDGLFLKGGVIIKVAMASGYSKDLEDGWFMHYYSLRLGKGNTLLVEDVKDYDFIRQINDYTQEITKEKMTELGFTGNLRNGEVLR
ncbi:hypothetical protein ES708_17162 [subsurface metagenome]